MTHAVRIKGGKATYNNRYVQTHRLQTEKAAGFPVYEKVPPHCLHTVPVQRS
jgi:carotenoid cleavage dioxygenase-like enzyme